MFDTGPLSAFARIGRLDLLRERYTGLAAWTIEVATEIHRGQHKYPELGDISHPPWLGEPIRLTELEAIVDIERARWALGGSVDQPDRHRGEAATIVLASQIGGIAVLDDLDARRFAAAQGIPLVGTLGILRASVASEAISLEEAWELTQRMRGLAVRLPPNLTKDWFEP